MLTHQEQVSLFGAVLSQVEICASGKEKDFAPIGAKPFELLILAVPETAFHVYSAVGEKGYTLGFEERTPYLGVTAAGYRAVGLDDPLPRQTLGAIAHCPANEPCAPRPAEHPCDLTIGHDLPARNFIDY